MQVILASAKIMRGTYPQKGIIPAEPKFKAQADKHLKADTMDFSDLEWANGHLLISTCLYGLLRPFDGINLHRMEGGFALPCTGGLKLQYLWKPVLTEALISAVNGDDGALIYLDTEEFRCLFDW